MKIIRRDNFDREWPGHEDLLIAENVEKHYLEVIVKALNRMDDMCGQYYYEAVEDSYKLQVF